MSKNWRLKNPSEPFVSTCLQGSISITYQKLVDVFGEPQGYGGYKTDAEWDLILTIDGEPLTATIYNWKDGHNYNDGNGLDVVDIKDWHIGGTEKSVVDAILSAIDENT